MKNSATAKRAAKTRSKQATSHERNGKWQHKREKILNVAVRLFWQNSYLATGIQEIADEANVNKASIYYYFKNKASILHEIMSNSLKELRDQTARAAESDLEPQKKLEIMIVNHIKWILSNIAVSQVSQKEKANLPPRLLRDIIDLRDEYESIFRNVVGEVIAQREIKYLDPRLASLFILGFANSVLLWYKPNKGLSIDEVGRAAYAFVAGALQLSNCSPVK